MTPELQSKLSKIYELVSRGATEGEQQAARFALHKIMRKYNISDEQLKSIHLKQYKFTYTTWMEEQLLIHIIKMMEGDIFQRASKRPKIVFIPLNYSEWIDIDCRYEYFRRHLKQQWKLICEPQLKKCRKAKTKNALRKKLQLFFVTQYLIKSGLVKPENITTAKLKNDTERNQRMLCADVEGGQYNKQVLTTNLLDY